MTSAAAAGLARLRGGGVSLGIDMGGTFVDCAVVGAAVLHIGKALTTPDDPVVGILTAVEHAASDSGLRLTELLGQATDIVHGTTLGLNALLTRDGGRVGLLTTRGHEDAILIGRVHQKVAGLRPQELTRASELRKPVPLVPRWLIRGVTERTDRDGAEIVPLDEGDLLAGADALVAQGCEALAIAFLWSFQAPRHEQRAAEILRAAHPAVAIVVSSDVAPVLGEYERTAATVVNAFLLKPFTGYLARLRRELAAHGFAGELWMTGMTGGLIQAEMAAELPVETLRSGPVGGIMAAARIGSRLRRREVIATDMGGTSFDVGLVSDGRPEATDMTVVAQLHLAIASVEVRSIGAGGGSVAWLDPEGGLHVGPRSAGASPGPACYGAGGTEPTITDADLVLGRLDPDARLGGMVRLDRRAAEAAIARIAGPLGIDVVSAADGIVRVADAQMADLIRTVTIERGHDPRRAILIAFGGAGPLHVARFAAEVGLSEVVVPPAASVLSAAGLATADYRRTYRRSIRMTAPFDVPVLVDRYAALDDLARVDFVVTGAAGPLVLHRSIELRYRRQTHQLTVPLASATAVADALGAIVEEFEHAYERTYGPGTGYAAAGVEATAVGVVASARRRSLPAGSSGARDTTPVEPIGRRSVFLDGWLEAPVYGGSSLAAGGAIEGPALIDWPGTTLVIHPRQSARVGPAGDVHLYLRPVAPR